MTDHQPSAGHSSAAEARRALLALNDGDHPFTVSEDGPVVVAERRMPLRSATTVVAGTASHAYRVELLDETGEYRRSTVQRNMPGADDAASVGSFSSWQISRPVDAVLAEHGWHPRASGLTRLFRGLTGRG